MPSSIRPARRALTVVIALVFAGCASAPTEKQINRAKIERTDKIEIFYNAEELGVVQDFGDGSRQSVMTAGLVFGPIGFLVASGAAFAASRAAIHETLPRSVEFQKAVASQTTADDMNLQVVSRLKNELERMGKTVKLTKVRVLPGVRLGLAVEPPKPLPETANNDPRSFGRPISTAYPAPEPRSPDKASIGFDITPGYTPLLLRVVAGYGSDDALADYRSFVVVDYALVDPDSRTYLTDGKFTAVDLPKGPKYSGWPALLRDAPAARDHVKRSLLEVTAPMAKLVFAFD